VTLEREEKERREREEGGAKVCIERKKDNERNVRLGERVIQIPSVGFYQKQQRKKRK